MSSYSVAEAKNHLPRLLDRMLGGEEVIITRRGKAIARLGPAEQPVRQPPVDADWLRSVRVHPRRGKVNTALLLKEAKAEGLR